MNNLISGIIITVGVINIALFGLWMRLVKIEASTDELPVYMYNSITTNFTILQISLAIVAFFTGIAAFFGYQTIKEGAEKKAIETAKKYLADNGKQLIKEEIGKRTIAMTPATYSLEAAKTGIDNAKEEEGDV